jgi:hypothetical protein
MTFRRVAASLAMLPLLCAAAGSGQENNVEMVSVKYDALKQEVLKQRGKVLLVDFWAGY